MLEAAVLGFAGVRSGRSQQVVVPCRGIERGRRAGWRRRAIALGFAGYQGDSSGRWGREDVVLWCIFDRGRPIDGRRAAVQLRLAGCRGGR